MATLGYIGDKVDLLVRQGATFGPMRVELTNPDATPVNLTGCTVRGQLRKKALSADVVAQFEVAVIDPQGGVFTFGFTDEVTAGIPAGESVKALESAYVWDMEVLDSTGRVNPLYYGDVKVFREVTRV